MRSGQAAGREKTFDVFPVVFTFHRQTGASAGAAHTATVRPDPSIIMMEVPMKIESVLLPLSALFLSAGMIFAQVPTDFEGDWTGRWENLTFSSKDSARMTVTLDTVLKTATVVLDLDGSVFGGTDPAPLVMSGSYDDTGFSVSGNADPYGPITMTGGNGGVLSGRAPDVPDSFIDSVTMSGTYDAASLSLDYIVYFAFGGGTANGVISMEKQTTTDVPVRHDGLPERFVLHQNYPNPFNPSTVIGYDLPTEAFVTLRVYDLSGSMVRTLWEGISAPGSYSVEWKPDGLAAGLYYYRLEAFSTSVDGGVTSASRGMFYLK